MTKNCLLQKRFLLSFFAYEMLFPSFQSLPYFLIYSLLQKESFVHWQESKLKYEGNLTVFLCSFIHFSVYGLWEKKTKLGADFSHFYSTWENCVNWIFLKFTSHLFPIFFIILSLMVLGDESSLQAQNWPCSFNWFLGWQYKKEATKKYCLKNILTQIERKLVLTLRLVSMLEKAMAPHSRTLAWKIPWTEEPGRLQSRGLRRVGHDWAPSLSLFTFTHWRRKWQPTPVFLPGESQGRGTWWAAIYGVAQSRTWLKWLSSIYETFFYKDM